MHAPRPKVPPRDKIVKHPKQQPSLIVHNQEQGLYLSYSSVYT